MLFSDKWQKIKDEKMDRDEKVLFVEPGQAPTTQRQLNLYYYFLFIKKILSQIQAKRVIEVGCGRGTISLYLARYLNLAVALLDNVAEAIDLARTEFASRGLAAEFFVADALRTDLPEAGFDAAVSIGLAEHIDRVGELFAEQYRILKPGGAMISLNIPEKFSIQFLNQVMRFFKKIFGGYKEGVRKDYYRNNLKPSDYQRLAEQAGFKEVKIVHVCPFPIYTPIKLTTDKKIAKLNKLILKLRKLFIGYPYQTNSLVAQAHFLVGYKK